MLNGQKEEARSSGAVMWSLKTTCVEIYLRGPLVVNAGIRMMALL